MILIRYRHIDFEVSVLLSLRHIVSSEAIGLPQTLSIKILYMAEEYSFI